MINRKLLKYLTITSRYSRSIYYEILLEKESINHTNQLLNQIREVKFFEKLITDEFTSSDFEGHLNCEIYYSFSNKIHKVVLNHPYNPKVFVITDDKHIGFVVSLGVNLHTKEIDYNVVYEGTDQLSNDFWFLDGTGIMLNNKAALLNNLVMVNGLLGLNKIFLFNRQSVNLNTESELDKLLLYKYGFKLESWQFWDEEVDDVFPNTADLIEAELEGTADELFFQSLPRIEQMMDDEIEKQRKLKDDKLKKITTKEDLWKKVEIIKQFERIEKYYISSLERRKQTKVGKPDWLTPDQIQEIRQLIAENRRLKEEMGKKQEQEKSEPNKSGKN